MDFFAHQEAARKKTGRLVLLFGAAVAAIVVSVYVVAVFAVGLTEGTRSSLHTIGGAYESDDDAYTHGAPGGGSHSAMSWWRPDVLMWVTLGVVGVIGVASLSKMAALRGGGQVVAASMGGTLITHETADPLEKRVLNVVEEMAIASGIPAPPVFVMREERGINAFAAGWGPGDAAIGVTRGCLETLSRDELQGVMAHEFSHILNGDMRMNIRIMGIIFGILAIHVIGRVMVRLGSRMSYAVRRDKGGNPGVAVLIIGLALTVIGAIGAFFGSMIRASISRQREFLADASAVQFTRNPDGIAGALKKIAGLAEGSRVRTPAAEEASHMFFGSAMLSGVSGLFATHPPLPERIRRIDPSWDGTIPRMAPVEEMKRSFTLDPEARAEMAMAGFMPRSVAPVRPTNLGAVEWIGRLGPLHVARANEIINMTPSSLLDAARSTYSARAVIFALLLDRDPAIRARQLDRVRAMGERGLVEETEKWIGPCAAMPRECRAPVAEIALGALAAMTEPQYRAFRSALTGLVEADAKRNVFEWMLERLVDSALAARFERPRRGIPEYYGLHRLGPECSMVLSMLAHAGGRSAEESQRAFGAGVSALGPDVAVSFVPAESCGLTPLAMALDALSGVAPSIKKSIVVACARVVAADGRVELAEAELLRGVCASLGVPMPPVLPGQRLVA